MSATRRMAGVVACGLALMVSGCAATPPAPTGAPGSSTPSGSPTPERPVGFFVPNSCLDVVGEERQAYFAAQGYSLVEGPGSTSTIAFDRFPVEHELRDVWCVWGTPDLGASVEIDIGPLPVADRPAVIAYLDTLHLTTTTEGEVTRYFMNGDELRPYGLILPAQVNILRPDSWIAVAISPGGPEPYELAVSIAAEVEALTNADVGAIHK